MKQEDGREKIETYYSPVKNNESFINQRTRRKTMVTVPETLEKLKNYQAEMSAHSQKLNGMMAIAYAGLFDSDTYEYTAPGDEWVADRLSELGDYVLKDVMKVEISALDDDGIEEAENIKMEQIDRHLGLQEIMQAYSSPSFEAFGDLSEHATARLQQKALTKAKPRIPTVEYVTELNEYIEGLAAQDAKTDDERKDLALAVMIQRSLRR